MWDTVQESTVHLSHEMPCPWCAHSSHTYLPCSDRCTCSGWSSFGQHELVAASRQ
jgi:hypothetical protein